MYRDNSLMGFVGREVLEFARDPWGRRSFLALCLAAVVAGAVGLVLCCLSGCATSVRDLTVTTPDGLTATMHARDTFSTTEVFLEAVKTEKGWKLKYGRKADPDEEAIKAAGGVAADVTAAAVNAAVKAAIKAAPVPGL